MTKATDILRKEHDAILKMLEATDEVASLLGRKQHVATETLDGLLEFFRLFADKCHHGKEEDLLFPALEKKGMPREGGPVGVMLHEHEQGRALVRIMADSAKQYAGGDINAGHQWARAARDYALLLREHIYKENNILFMMAERMLSDAEQQELARAFERAEVEKMGLGTHERLHASMDRLMAAIFQGQV